MNREIVPDLDENIAYIEKRFEGCADAVMRRLWMGDEKAGDLCYLYGFNV